MCIRDRHQGQPDEEEGEAEAADEGVEVDGADAPVVEDEEQPEDEEFDDLSDESIKSGD